MIYKAVHTLLENDATLAAKIRIPNMNAGGELTGGNTSEIKCFVGKIPIKIPNPSIRLSMVDKTPIECHAETSSGWDMFEMQVDVFSDTYPQAAEIAADVRRVLEGYTGTVASQNINDIRFVSESDMWNETEEIEELEEYRRMLRFEILLNK